MANKFHTEALPAATGLQFIDLSAASFRGRIGWRLSELFLREWLDETGGVSYFNPVPSVADFRAIP